MRIGLFIFALYDIHFVNKSNEEIIMILKEIRFSNWDPVIMKNSQKRIGMITVLLVCF